jgi:hypothetical protein
VVHPAGHGFIVFWFLLWRLGHWHKQGRRLQAEGVHYVDLWLDMWLCSCGKRHVSHRVVGYGRCILHLGRHSHLGLHLNGYVLFLEDLLLSPAIFRCLKKSTPEIWNGNFFCLVVWRLREEKFLSRLVKGGTLLFRLKRFELPFKSAEDGVAE